MVKSILNVGAVLPAAGIGARYGERKQFKHLGNKPLFLYALNVFLKCKEIAEIVIVTNEDEIEYIYHEIETLNTKKSIKVIAGGPRRQDSVMNGCTTLSSSMELVTIQPLISVSFSQDFLGTMMPLHFLVIGWLMQPLEEEEDSLWEEYREFGMEMHTLGQEERLITIVSDLTLVR